MIAPGNSRWKAKTKVLFVGAFIDGAVKDGSVGGQMYACRALVQSPLKDYVDWRLLDSTSRSTPPPGIHVRLIFALKRIIVFTFILSVRSVDTILIFSSYRFASLLEKGLMVFIAKLFRKRLIISFRSEITRRNDALWFEWYKQKMVDKADIIMCQSHQALDSIREVFQKLGSTMQVIPNWIDSNLYSFEKGWPNNEKAIVFVFVGAIEAFKGVYELIEASERLSKQQLPFKLIMCGKGSAYSHVQQMVRQRGLEDYVDLRGWVLGEDKMCVYKNADVFVLPSYSEGVPNAILEAMASSMPIIATSVGGIPQLVKHGANGLLVKPKDPSALVSAMRHFCLNSGLIEMMGKASRERVDQVHDIEVIWPMIAKILGVHCIRDATDVRRSL